MTPQNTEKTAHTIYSPLYHLLSVFFMCLGVTGIILMAASVPELNFAAAPLIIISCVIITALYLSNHFARPLFYAVLAAIVVFCIVYILSDRELFAAQWQYLFGGMIPEPGEESGEIGRIALILTVFFSLLIFFFDILIRSHTVNFFITTAFILVPTIFGYSFPAYAIIFTVIYQLAFFIMPLSFRKTVTKSEKMQQRIRVKTTLLAVAAALAAFAIATPIALGTKEKTFDNVARMENSALNNLGLSPFSLLYNNEGNINRGDNELNGVITLRLSADRGPEEYIYMRGYFGGNYYGDYWDGATDDVIFKTLAPVSDISHDPVELGGVYNALRYLTTTENKSSEISAVSMNIRNLNINRSVIFRPYNANEEEMSKTGSYDFKFYEYKDLSMGFSDNDPEDLLSYRRLYRDYYADAYDNYTYITAESIPQLKQLVADHPLEDPEEITNYIIKTLDEHAEYTLNPGAAPEGVDTVDYFMFENHKGYCQQFASAAVLMYRLYGIPARYATGFRVKPEEFTLNEKTGMYEAEVTDQSAHAWPEILIPEYGWVPVEVTPSANRGLSGGNLSADDTPLSQNYEHTPPAPTAADNTEPATEDENDTDEPTTQAPEKDDDNDSSSSSSSSSESGEKASEPVNVLPWLIPLLAGAGCAAAYICLRKRVVTIKNMNFEQTYKKLRVLLKNAPDPVTCNIYDKEFPEQLHNAVPVISRDEAADAYENILTALYSENGAIDTHTVALHKLYTKCSEYIIPRIPAGKRAVVKYIRMLG